MASKRERLLQRARDGPAGFTLGELWQLYNLWGFVVHRGGKHPEIVKHPDHPELGRAVLPNHKSFGKEYINEAVRLIDKLQKKEEEEQNAK